MAVLITERFGHSNQVEVCITIPSFQFSLAHITSSWTWLFHLDRSSMRTSWNGQQPRTCNKLWENALGNQSPFAEPRYRIGNRAVRSYLIFQQIQGYIDTWNLLIPRLCFILGNWINAFLQVIANLPFNITTQVVKQLLPLGCTFSHIILLLQVRWFLGPRRLASCFYVLSCEFKYVSHNILLAMMYLKWSWRTTSSILICRCCDGICLTTVQDEAAIRLVDASPDADEYRPISILINFFSGYYSRIYY